VSITSCAMSLVGMPLLLVFGSNAAPASAQLALTGVALTATVGSTAVLHYFTSPYVHALTEIPTDHSVTTAVATDDTAVYPELTVNVAAQLQAQTDADDTLNNRVFVAERMSILGRKKHTVFAVKDVVPQSDSSRRPFVSFQTVDTDMQYQAAQQRKTEKFYIHSHLFADKPLLQKLLGRPLKDDEKATIEELQEKYLQQKQQQKQQTPA
jgi:electron transfer flavoprotein alpha subunit